MFFGGEEEEEERVSGGGCGGGRGSVEAWEAGGCWHARLGSRDGCWGVRGQRRMTTAHRRCKVL
jgi:hypothetical protein